MKIDKEHVKQTFTSYVKNYDDTNEKIRLKIDHTYRVAALCEQIAKAEKLSEEDVEFAWLTGMLHDLGRFEQLRRFNTFLDAESVDHAGLGADILFQENGTICIRDFCEPYRDALLERVIRLHNVYRLPADLNKEERVFSEILRDADKIDILKVNVEVPVEEIYNVPVSELKSAEISEAVVKAFYEHHAIARSLKKTIADHLVGHISLVYELVYPVSLELVMKQGYLEKLLHFESDNEKTCEQLSLMRQELHRWIQQKMRQRSTNG